MRNKYAIKRDITAKKTQTQISVQYLNNISDKVSRVQKYRKHRIQNIKSYTNQKKLNREIGTVNYSGFMY